jgi:hypothetical protein
MVPHSFELTSSYLTQEYPVRTFYEKHSSLFCMMSVTKTKRLMRLTPGEPSPVLYLDPVEMNHEWIESKNLKCFEKIFAP